MVSPERIRHRFSAIELDERDLDGPHVFIDFKVDGILKWYLEYHVRFRKLTLAGTHSACGMHIRGVTRDGRLRDYLASIIPPEILARCAALSMVVRDG